MDGIRNEYTSEGQLRLNSLETKVERQGSDHSYICRGGIVDIGQRMHVMSGYSSYCQLPVSWKESDQSQLTCRINKAFSQVKL